MNFCLEILVSNPAIPRFKKQFQADTGLFKLQLESDFSYNAVFEIKSFYIMNLNTWDKYNLNITQKFVSLAYQNYSGVHNVQAAGQMETDMTPSWDNNAIVAVAELQSNNMSYTTQSGSIVQDYRSSISGKQISYLVLNFSKLI